LSAITAFDLMTVLRSVVRTSDTWVGVHKPNLGHTQLIHYDSLLTQINKVLLYYNMS